MRCPNKNFLGASFFFDRGASLRSLHPPPAAVATSPNEQARRPHNPKVICSKPNPIMKNENTHLYGECFHFWLREPDLNQQPSGYEPDELPDCSIPRYCLQPLLPYYYTQLFSIMQPFFENLEKLFFAPSRHLVEGL